MEIRPARDIIYEWCPFRGGYYDEFGIRAPWDTEALIESEVLEEDF